MTPEFALTFPVLDYGKSKGKLRRHFGRTVVRGLSPKRGRARHDSKKEKGAIQHGGHSTRKQIMVNLPVGFPPGRAGALPPFGRADFRWRNRAASGPERRRPGA